MSKTKRKIKNKKLHYPHLHVHITKQMKDRIDQVMTNSDYCTETEFIRAAIRDKLKQYEVE